MNIVQTNKPFKKKFKTRIKNHIAGELSSFALYAILCAASIANTSVFYTELMKGLGASSRLFELRNRIPAIPLSG